MTDSMLAGGTPLPATPQTPTSPTPPTTAGGLLRQARQAQGLHIAALAAAIKVTPNKLEALESEQFDRLPDATFTRALAQAVCRSLKIDPVPVLALLPTQNVHRLEEVAEGLKTPFNERPGRLVPGQWLKLSGATMAIAAVLVVGALVLYVMPAGWIAIPRVGSMAPASTPDSATNTPEPGVPGTESEPAESKTAGAGETSPQLAVAASGTAAAVTTAASSTTSSVPVAASATPAVAPPGVAASSSTLQFTTTAPSWIGVTDAGGKSLIGRLVLPGETVDVDGTLPLTLRIGHASTVQLTYRGAAMDLKKYIHNDFARLQLK